MMSSENGVMLPKEGLKSSTSGPLVSENGAMSSENGMMSSPDDEVENDKEWIYGARGLQQGSTTDDGSNGSSETPTRVQRPPREMSARGDSVANGNNDGTLATSQVMSLSPCNSLLWEGAGKAPAVFRRGTATVWGDTVYLNSCDTREVFGYRDVTTTTTSWWGEEKEVRGEWLRFPDYPVKFFSLAVVGSKVTGVGGVRDGLLRTTCSNQLLCLEKERDGWKWVRGFPSMPTPRGFTGVIATARHLVVAGGGSMEKKLTTVEVLDVEMSQWTTATPLPQPLTSVSMVVQEGQVYLGGFFTQRKDEYGSSLLASQSVLTCSLVDLLSLPWVQRPGGGAKRGGVVSNSGGSGTDGGSMASVGGAYSKQDLNEGVGGASCKQGGVALNGERKVDGALSEQGGGVPNGKVGGASDDVSVSVNRSLCGGGGPLWRNLKELPTACSTLVSLGNRLVAVGGVLLSGPYSSEVYGYNPRDDSWSVIGRLGIQRSLPLAVVVSGNRLVVVGGLKPDYTWGGTNRSEGVEFLTATL
jgi:hypothetical protein